MCCCWPFRKKKKGYSTASTQSEPRSKTQRPKIKNQNQIKPEKSRPLLAPPNRTTAAKVKQQAIKKDNQHSKAKGNKRKEQNIIDTSGEKKRVEKGKTKQKTVTVEPPAKIARNHRLKWPWTEKTQKTHYAEHEHVSSESGQATSTFNLFRLRKKRGKEKTPSPRQTTTSKRIVTSPPYEIGRDNKGRHLSISNSSSPQRVIQPTRKRKIHLNNSNNRPTTTDDHLLMTTIADQESDDESEQVLSVESAEALFDTWRTDYDEEDESDEEDTLYEYPKIMLEYGDWPPPPSYYSSFFSLAAKHYY